MVFGCPGKVFLDCTGSQQQNQCAKTCQNLNVPCPSNCVPGCICPNDQVEDENGTCINREECSCLYSDVYYSSGVTLQLDCNKCTCQGGSWKCSQNQCTKTCLVHGDGHYITFDGQRFFFDSNCEYIFAQDFCLQEVGTFQILIESVACCENGVTCSRVIKILLEEIEIKLLDGKVQATYSNETLCIENVYSLHMVGLYLILEFSNGITVIWDKHTRISVTLDPKWQNKVCGLCGNFNSRTEDDLTTKSNSLVTNPMEFVASWKSTNPCSVKVLQTSPCDRNPYCHSWAARKCAIIKGDIFEGCHKKVDPIPYYDACVEEACACDSEGKYLGFCTAVAVYAEACSKAGVCIDWRTPDSCPIYCDYYNRDDECSWHYKPCGTIITKTCSEHFIGKKFAAVLEGCYAKCPDNAPYLDENLMKCVTLPDCTCYYNGQLLQPNEVQDTPCGQCMCQNGTTICQGTTTTVTATTTGSTTGFTTGPTQTTVTGTPTVSETTITGPTPMTVTSTRTVSGTTITGPTPTTVTGTPSVSETTITGPTPTTVTGTPSVSETTITGPTPTTVTGTPSVSETTITGVTASTSVSALLSTTGPTPTTVTGTPTVSETSSTGPTPTTVTGTTTVSETSSTGPTPTTVTGTPSVSETTITGPTPTTVTGTPSVSETTITGVTASTSVSALLSTTGN
ncbi:mucin-19-like [Heptranchias perlo]|uniref:mucin-19-like n=1 Tax=Heptranchias perlo TaxID=212740 RepID=UPI00355A18C7